jgi:hypothetical protein
MRKSVSARVERIGVGGRKRVMRRTGQYGRRQVGYQALRLGFDVVAPAPAGQYQQRGLDTATLTELFLFGAVTPS